MKLVTDKKAINDVLAEIMLEYTIISEAGNPFASEAPEASDEPAKDDKAEEGGEEGGDDKKKDDKGGGEDKAMSIKFNPSAVKKYNSNTDWKSGEGEVKKITSKGIEVEVDGNTVIVNVDDITERINAFFKKR
jgi:hypothetical protein